MSELTTILLQRANRDVDVFLNADVTMVSGKERISHVNLDLVLQSYQNPNQRLIQHLETVLPKDLHDSQGDYAGISMDYFAIEPFSIALRPDKEANFLRKLFGILCELDARVINPDAQDVLVNIKRVGNNPYDPVKMHEAYQALNLLADQARR